VTAGTGRDAQMLDMGRAAAPAASSNETCTPTPSATSASASTTQQNRYCLAGGNPVSNIELDGQINTEGGGATGGTSTTSTSTQSTSETSGGTSNYADHEG
jgi:hypothetical protein